MRLRKQASGGRLGEHRVPMLEPKNSLSPTTTDDAKLNGDRVGRRSWWSGLLHDDIAVRFAAGIGMTTGFGLAIGLAPSYPPMINIPMLLSFPYIGAVIGRSAVWLYRQTVPDDEDRSE